MLRLQRAAADIRAQITNRRNKFFQDAQTEMTKAREELNTYQEQLRDRSQVLEHTELLAPSDGIVNNIRATTLGAVLRPGDVVLELLPTGGDLIAETKISPTDIAFVTVGQTAFVKRSMPLTPPSLAACATMSSTSAPTCSKKKPKTAP